jgi:hypothetical protein
VLNEKGFCIFEGLLRRQAVQEVLQATDRIVANQKIKYSPEMDPYRTTAPGDLVIIHNHTIHGSDANQSKTHFRRAHSTVYMRKGSSLIPGQFAKRQEVDVYN